MLQSAARADREAAAAKVAVAGCGNIGSHLVPLLARMDEVGELLLIDPDRYEERNLRGQDCLPADARRPKALAQAERARRIAPGKRVGAVVDRFENLPLGELRRSLLVSCLDSLAARVSVNRVAWHLGAAWVDAGVLADGLLARVSVYIPGEGRPCLECGFDDRRYENVDHVSSCGDGAGPVATRGPNDVGLSRALGRKDRPRKSSLLPPSRPECDSRSTPHTCSLHLDPSSEMS